MSQLNLIINVLQNCSKFQPKNYYEIDKALAAARELKALQPVGWVTRGTFSGRFQMCDSDDVGAFQVYALDEVTK
jgi:hypothetical protein